MATPAVTPTAWDEDGNPVQPNTSAQAWDENGNPVQAAAPPKPEASISAVHPDTSVSGHIARWAENVSNDIKYGTDTTGVGTVLKKMGAHGVYSGEPEAVGDFMASMPLGLLKATQGAGEVGQGKTLQGAGDIASGAAQAATMPGAFAAPEVADKIPTTFRAGQALEDVGQAAKDVPVRLDTATKTIKEFIKEEAAGGDSVPAVKKLADRLESGEKLSYDEIKRFQGNISGLSASEKIGYKPNTFRLLGQLNGELKEALTEAADVEGKGEKFVQAMKDYHNAMRLSEFTDKMKSAAVTAALGAAGLKILQKFIPQLQ